jgi:hypothetical protein
MANMMHDKLNQMNDYEGVSYTSVTMKNTFHQEDEHTIKEINLNEFNYMTSLEIKMIGDEKEITQI